MAGLIIKDLINLKRYGKILGVLIAIYAIMSFINKDVSMFNGFFTVVLAMITISSYSFDEAAKWDSYALSMPVDRKDIVRGKYCLLLIITLIGLGISLLFTVSINLYTGSNSLLKDFEFSIIGGLGLLFLYSIIIPFITRFGVEKARIIIIIVLMLPMAIGYLIKNSFNNEIIIPEIILEISELFLQYKSIIVSIGIVLALSISYNISVKIYQKKQF
ncbi:MAG TPA: ABC-2 transporter permease [Clostridiales bacterium]|nr:ABC-2 transporter permease [Clostridiales bacterium]